jgi:triosephosphate isomerase
MKQIEDSLFTLKAEEIAVIIAYEPIWAIGTGKTATAIQAQEVHGLIRARIAKQFGDKTGNADINLIYGGSCKSDNAKELFSQTDIDGGLIGGASLDAAEFSHISNSF